MKTWLIPYNKKDYRLDDAFKELGVIDWRQNINNISIGDIAYIYESSPTSKIVYKCIINKVNLRTLEIDDNKFLISKELNKKNKYFEIEVVKNLREIEGLELNNLKNNGLLTVQGQSEIKEKTIDYINLIMDYNLPRVETVDDWILVLNNEIKNEKGKMLKIFKYLYGAYNYTANSAKIAEKIGQPGNYPTLDIYHFSERVIKLLEIPKIIGTDGKNYRTWNIPFQSSTGINKHLFYYKLRPELVTAIEIVFPNWIKNVDELEEDFDLVKKQIKGRKKIKLSNNVKLEEIKLNIVNHKEVDRSVNDKMEKEPDYINKVYSELVNTHNGIMIEEYIYEMEYKKLESALDKKRLKEMEDFFKNRKDRYGFDILSFELEEGIYVKKYIEVKATTTNEKTPIDISANEINFAKENIDHYYIYRVIIESDYLLKLSIITGKELFSKYNLVPTKYKIYG